MEWNRERRNRPTRIITWSITAMASQIIGKRVDNSMKGARIINYQYGKIK